MNIKVDNALISGFIPLLAMEYISIERLVTPGPVVKKLITKSSIDIVKAISRPDIIPGFICGNIIFRKV